MAYLAYLHSTPVVENGKRNTKSRLAQYLTITGAAPKMPDVRDRYLINWLSDLGTVQMGANGFLPISWQEIKSWADLTSRKIDWWESQTLRLMSESYSNWSHKAQKADVEPPWYSEETLKQDDSSKFKDSFKNAKPSRKR